MNVVVFDDFHYNAFSDFYTNNHHGNLTESQWNELKKLGSIRILDERNSQQYDDKCYFVRIRCTD